MRTLETIDFRTRYGATETNGLAAGEMQAILDSIDEDRTTYWSDPDLWRIFRLRLISDPGFPYWDVSYCYGTLRDGTNVRVSLPFSQLPKRRWRAEIVRYAKQDKVYARGIGILDETVVSMLV